MVHEDTLTADMGRSSRLYVFLVGPKMTSHILHISGISTWQTYHHYKVDIDFPKPDPKHFVCQHLLEFEVHRLVNYEM